MAKDKLTAIKVKTAGAGRHSDGGGLHLEKPASGAGKWIFRYSFAGRRRDMGLGSAAEVTLAQARKDRDRWAMCIARGIDPINERDRERREAVTAARRDDPTLTELVDMVFEARKSSLKGDGEAGRWMSPLKTHILPRLGKLTASTITTAEFVDVLRPIWNSKPTVARKAHGRLRMALEVGRRIGYAVDPVTIERVPDLLGDLHIEHAHIEATPWQRIPDLFAALRGTSSDSSGRMCLRLLMLTAVRSDSARGARFGEIDGDIWTVPKERIKGLKRKVDDFRVPLSAAALEIVEQARQVSRDPVNGLLFASPNNEHKPISQNALLNVLNDMGEAGRPHGLRSSFRDWVQDTDACSYEVAETVLGHIVGGKVERSYARSDLLDRRRVVMHTWAAHVTRCAMPNRSG